MQVVRSLYVSFLIDFYYPYFISKLYDTVIQKR
jgi:hypothetical protein